MVTERKQAKYPRVYPKHGAWYWVDPTSGRWIRLCSLKDDETTLVARLAYDAAHHRANAATTRRSRKAIHDLFEGADHDQ